MPVYDIHQHLWPEEVLVALSRRTQPPRATWANGCWTVELATEPAFEVHPRDHDPDRRAAALDEAGIDRALVALSSAIGIESLPADEAVAILEEWRAATSQLPDELGAWATVPLLAEPGEQIAFAEAALDVGAAGVVLPAGALAAPLRAERMDPLLAALQDRMVPLFVHPGPPPEAPGAPAWWGPATSYVAELAAAWHVFAAWVRPAHPRLHVVFAALAGLAPLHAERTAGRGGPEAAYDELAFYDTSSYGPRARRAMTAAVGSAQLVHGSDHPVLPLAPPAEENRATAADNAARLLGLAWAIA